METCAGDGRSISKDESADLAEREVFFNPNFTADRITGAIIIGHGILLGKADGCQRMMDEDDDKQVDVRWFVARYLSV